MSSRGGTEGPTFQIVGSCNVFWDLQTFTGNSFVISVQSLSHSLNLLLPKFLSSGILLRSMPLPCSRRGFLQRPFSGVGAVLSEQEDGKLHPCAFYSCHLSPAECNYDIGDWELLAIKLALEEWRHWLEGAAQPFIMWTDHKNLEYLRSARRLNSRQARWLCFLPAFISLSPTGRGHGI